MTTNLPAAVDWRALADQLQTVMGRMLHDDNEPDLYGTDFYAEALRRVFGARPAHAPTGRDLPYDTVHPATGLVTDGQHMWTLKSHTIADRLNAQAAERQVRELRAEVRRVYAEARRDLAEHLRDRCNERTVPSRLRREGVLLAAHWLDPRPGEHSGDDRRAA